MPLLDYVSLFTSKNFIRQLIIVLKNPALGFSSGGGVVPPVSSSIVNRDGISEERAKAVTDDRIIKTANAINNIDLCLILTPP